MEAREIVAGDHVANVYGRWNHVANAKTRRNGKVALAFHDAENVDEFDPDDILTVKRDGVITGPFAAEMRRYDDGLASI